YAALDDGDVAVPDDRHLYGCALGLCGSGLGWLLGMGPGGKCVADAMADRDGVSAFGDDAGKARQEEDLERVADLRHFHADDCGNSADAVPAGEFGACLCAVAHRELVLDFPGDCAGGVFVHLYPAT